MSINQRIRMLRQELNLSQAKFAAAISISSGYIAGIELGNRRVNDRIIKLICSTYRVREEWLRTGMGDMFLLAQDDTLQKAVHTFELLRPEFQDYVLEQMQALLRLQKKLGKAPRD